MTNANRWLKVWREATKRSRLRYYGVAALTVLLALGITLMLGPLLSETPAQLFLVAVTVSAWYGGMEPGLLATALSTQALNYILLEPRPVLATPLGIIDVHLTMLFLSGLVVTYLNESRRSAVRREQALRGISETARREVQELERLNRLKDDFLSTVSHELRTPIATIKMAIQMLEISLKALGVLEDKANPVSRYFKILQSEGNRELALIDDLLNLTRLDAGTEPLTMTTIALQLYIPHLAESFSERARQRQQRLVFQLPDALPDFTTDLPYLERILTELLHNACKYTPDAETITVAAQAMPTALEIRISNTGVEIPATEYDRIFDKFYRIPNSDPWKHGGTGLGLALVKKLIERLGGEIRVTSGDGQTSFTLTFSL